MASDPSCDIFPERNADEPQDGWLTANLRRQSGSQIAGLRNRATLIHSEYLQPLPSTIPRLLFAAAGRRTACGGDYRLVDLAEHNQEKDDLIELKNQEKDGFLSES